MGGPARDGRLERSPGHAGKRGREGLALVALAGRAGVPAVLDQGPDRLGVAFVPGRGLTAWELRDPGQHARLGQLVRAWQQVAPPVDPVPLDQAWRRRAGQQAATLGARGEALRRVVAAGARPGRRVWAHRDLQPRNVVADASGALWVIDWEHARPDHPLTDWAIWRATLRDSPSAARAWDAACGADAEPPAVRAAALALYALGTLSWAQRHRDPTHLEAGEAAEEMSLQLARG